MSQTLLFQLSSKLQLELCAVFQKISDCARVSLTPLEKDILSKLHASVFMNMEPSLSLPLIEQNINPRMWADGKTGSITKCCSCRYQAQRPTHISTSKAVCSKTQG